MQASIIKDSEPSRCCTEIIIKKATYSFKSSRKLPIPGSTLIEEEVDIRKQICPIFEDVVAFLIKPPIFIFSKSIIVNSAQYFFL